MTALAPSADDHGSLPESWSVHRSVSSVEDTSPRALMPQQPPQQQQHAYSGHDNLMLDPHAHAHLGALQQHQQQFQQQQQQQMLLHDSHQKQSKQEHIQDRNDSLHDAQPSGFGFAAEARGMSEDRPASFDGDDDNNAYRQDDEGGSSINRFIRKTFEMVSDQSTFDIVSWDELGETFIVKREPEFASLVLPRYFRHKNFSSFVRQLNFYSFHKRSHQGKFTTFQHPYFRRGAYHALHLIKRKSADTHSSYKDTLSLVSTQLTELKRSNAQLQNVQQQMLHVLGRYMRAYPLPLNDEPEKDDIAIKRQRLSLELAQPMPFAAYNHGSMTSPAHANHAHQSQSDCERALFDLTAHQNTLPNGHAMLNAPVSVSDALYQQQQQHRMRDALVATPALDLQGIAALLGERSLHPSTVQTLTALGSIAQAAAQPPENELELMRSQLDAQMAAAAREDDAFENEETPSPMPAFAQPRPLQHPPSHSLSHSRIARHQILPPHLDSRSISYTADAEAAQLVGFSPSHESYRMPAISSSAISSNAATTSALASVSVPSTASLRPQPIHPALEAALNQFDSFRNAHTIGGVKLPALPLDFAPQHSMSHGHFVPPPVLAYSPSPSSVSPYHAASTYPLGNGQSYHNSPESFQNQASLELASRLQIIANVTRQLQAIQEKGLPVTMHEHSSASPSPAHESNRQQFTSLSDIKLDEGREAQHGFDSNSHFSSGSQFTLPASSASTSSSSPPLTHKRLYHER